LRVHQIPVARAALRVLLFPGRIVEREFEIVEAAKLVVIEDGDAHAVRGHRQLDIAAAQQRKHLAEARVHAVLARAQIHRLDRQPVEHRSDLFQIEPVQAGRIAIAERARQVALVRQTDPEREALRGAAARCVGNGLQHRSLREKLTAPRSPRPLPTT
jgi:hypothetical protein